MRGILIIAAVLTFALAAVVEWPIEAVEPVAIGLAFFAAAHFSGISIKS